MPKRWQIIVFAVCTLAAMLYVTVSRPREPSYNGRPLSEWIERHGESGSPADQEEAAAAIRQIGAKAVPHLLVWFRENPQPTWKIKLKKLAEALNVGFGQAWLERENPRSRYAAEAFCILGAAAETAIPALTRMASETSDYPKAAIAADTLAQLGKQGLPPLLALLTNQDKELCRNAVGALRHQGTNALPAIPQLVGYLNDQKLAGRAATTLGALGLEPNLVIPALSNKLHQPDWVVRWVAVTALGRFREQAGLAVPAVKSALVDSNQEVRMRATNTLFQIAPETFTNGPPRVRFPAF